ncbi:MAG: DUF4421 family protein [Deltaproteobacteria bacterium]|jgi:hypothetical protein|nr:DUF4421 family protein [Deltaproteobacteria bacterium]
MFKKTVVLFAVTIAGSTAYTQESSGKFETPEDKFLIKPYIEVPGLNLEFRSRLSNGKLVNWTPNYRAQTGLGISYDGLIGVSASAKGELSREDELLKGRSEYQDFRFRFPWRRISIEVGYQKLRGFFAENTTDFDPGSTVYLKRPDLVLESKYASFTVTLKPDQYSLAAAFDQSERQTSSGGSWLGTLHIVENVFEDIGAVPLIPVGLQVYFPNEALVTKGRFLSATVGGGYGHLWSFGETWFAFSQILVGVGAQSGKSSDGTQEFSVSELAGNIKLDLGVGSNGKKYVSGILVSTDQTTNQTTETELGKRNILVHVFFGFRL